MNTHHFSCLFLIFFLLIVGVSCQPQNTTTKTRLSFWCPPATDPWGFRFWNKTIHQYMDLFPDVEIELNLNATWGAITGMMGDQYLRGKGPDVVWLGNTLTGFWKQKGYLQSITTRFNQWSRELRKSLALDFWAQVPYDYLIDNDWWVLPITSGSTTLFWRTDLVQQVIGVNRPPATFDELYDWAYRINTTVEGVWGMGQILTNDVPHFFTPVLQSFGGSIFDENFNCSLTTKEAQDAIAHYVKYYDNNIAPFKNMPALPYYANLEPLFIEGKLAFYIQGPWAYWVFLGHVPFGMSATPAGPYGRFTFLGGEGMAIPTNSKHPDEAWAFMQWIFQNVDGISDAGISAVPSKTTEPFCPIEPLPAIASAPQITSVLNSFLYAVPLQFPNLNHPSVAIVDQDRNVISRMLQLVANGTTSIQEATKATCQYLNEQTKLVTRIILPVWSGEEYEIAFTVVLSVMLAVAFAGIIASFIYREHPLLWLASPFFCALIWLGSILSLAALFFFAYPATQSRCLAKYWLGFVGFTLLFAALFAKTWRAYMIVRASSKFQKAVISFRMTLTVAVIALSPVILLLILWSAINTLDVEYVEVENSKYRQLQCTSDHYWVWMGLLFGYLAAFCIFGLVLAFLSRKIAYGLNESRAINFSIMTTALIAVIVIPIVYGLETTPAAVIIIAIAGGCAGVALIWIFVFGLKFYYILRGKEVSKADMLRGSSFRSTSGSLASTHTQTSTMT